VADPRSFRTDLNQLAASPDRAFRDLVGTLRDRATRATQVLDATRQALHDVATCYRRADGRA
jgi:hypothetical protein